MTANGTEISDGASLSGSQVLRVYGSNLTPPYFSLRFNGVEYTPLDYGDGYVEYVLQDNGTYEIRNEHDVVMEFEISDVVVPAFLPARLTMFVTSANSFPTIARADSKNVVGNCINYDKMVYPSMGNLLLYIRDITTTLDENEFSIVNGTIRDFGADGNVQDALLVTPEDPAKIVQILYEGFIIAVANYTTTPQP